MAEEIVQTSPEQNFKVPLKFLFVSLESLSGDLAWTVKKEGHEVKVYIKARTDQDVYNGFIEKIERWEDHIDWADVIIFDDVEFGDIADKLRKKGKLVVGGSVYEEAIAFLRENSSRYVFKPSGNTPSGGKGLLFIGEEEDGKDLLEILDQNKKIWQKKAPTFILQKYVAGVEVAVGAFFNGKDFVYPINVNFEHKRIFPGDIGPFSGEMGTLMFWSEPNNLFRATLGKMLPALQECGYVGYIDINCIVNGRGIYPLEFTARFGYPTIQIQQEGITLPMGEFLYRLARGEDFEMKTKKGFQIGVRVMVPTYFAKAKDKEIADTYRDLPILFKKRANMEGIHIEDVKLEDGVWRIAGESGVLLVVTGSGTTVEETQKQVYSRIQNIMVLNMFYRTDIGGKWVTDSDKLHTWGYLS